MKTIIAVLTVFILSACSNLSGYSAEYQAEHQRVFWSSLNSGGGMSGDAQAWANLRAHEAAERKVGK